jgi:hypothetical protein
MSDTPGTKALTDAHLDGLDLSNVKERWTNDRERRGDNGRLEDEKPWDFVARVYANFLGKGLTTGDLRKHDINLYTAVMRAKSKGTWPETVDLPTAEEYSQKSDPNSHELDKDGLSEKDIMLIATRARERAIDPSTAGQDRQTRPLESPPEDKDEISPNKDEISPNDGLSPEAISATAARVRARALAMRASKGHGPGK